MLLGRYFYMHGISIDEEYIDIGSKEKANEVAHYLSDKGSGDECIISMRKKKKCDDTYVPPLVAFSILGVLIIFAVATGVLILQCRRRGKVA